MPNTMEVRIAAAKVGKYATSESGDTLEMVERPHGGLSLVLADGQRSGRAAKAISNIVVRKAVALLAEGVRDGAVARAAHDYLFLHRGGQVSAELCIVSLDLVSRTLVVSRNSHCPVIVVKDGQLSLLDDHSLPIGIYSGTKPVIAELPLEPETTLVVFTDGLLQFIAELPDPLPNSQESADFIRIEDRRHGRFAYLCRCGPQEVVQAAKHVLDLFL